MSMVIAFPAAGNVSVRRGTARRRERDGPRRDGAEIVILPVVRIERHEAPLPGPVQMGSGARRVL